jgi:His/Glu/Gln/Arg/opine family amino acid ABC transporter permease subunit
MLVPTSIDQLAAVRSRRADAAAQSGHTVKATFIAYTIALLFGLVLAILRRSGKTYITWPLIGFVEFIKSTPLLIQIYFVFYIFPNFGVVLPAMVAGVLAAAHGWGRMVDHGEPSLAHAELMACCADLTLTSSVFVQE